MSSTALAGHGFDFRMEAVVAAGRVLVDGPGGEVADQFLELKTVLEVLGRRLRFIDGGHDAE
jgi:hypothetical protein